MFVLTLLLFVPVTFSVSVGNFTLPMHAVSHDEDGEKVAWPMYDFDLEENLVSHGVHCVGKVQECLDILAGNATDQEQEGPTVHKMHCAHCQRLVRLTKRFFEAHHNFKVSDDLCSVVLQTRKRRRAAGTGYYGGGGSFRYRIRRSIVTRTETHSLQEQEDYLKAENFGDLLMKDWKGEKLTKFEANFIRRIESEEAVVATARALICKNGPLASLELMNLIKESYEICW